MAVLVNHLPDPLRFFFFFFNDTATTEIYTLSLHDALPIFEEERKARREGIQVQPGAQGGVDVRDGVGERDRKSTRLNSSHLVISYAVFCLKKKKRSLRPPFDRKSTPTPTRAETRQDPR